MNSCIPVPRVSVVIPMHNREQTIEAAVTSALAQDVADLEVIVIDDGSTDDGAGRVHALEDVRVRYIRQPKSGANPARNLGIELARGRYVAMLDSDDVFLPGHLQRALEVLDHAPDAVVFARVVVDRGAGRTFIKPRRPPRAGEHISDYVMRRAGFIQTSTLVMTRKLARAVGYLEWLRAAQDTDFAVRASAGGVPFVMIEQPGAVWRDQGYASRISAAADPDHLLRWLDFIEPAATRSALTGYRGWHIARALALQGRKGQALRFFASAAVRGCYSPRLILRIFGQILLAGRGYRMAADGVLMSRAMVQKVLRAAGRSRP